MKQIISASMPKTESKEKSTEKKFKTLSKILEVGERDEEDNDSGDDAIDFYLEV